MRPARTCIGCRETADRVELLRIVKLAGKLQIDEKKSLPGRGSWIHQKLECFDSAITRGAFPRAFRSKIAFADLANLKEQAEKMLDK